MATTKTATPVVASPTEATVRIFIAELEGDGSGKIDQTVPVSINGKTLIIKRGVTVDLPAEYYTVLKQSGRFPGI